MIYVISGAQPELTRKELESVLKTDLSDSFDSGSVLLLDIETKNLTFLQDRLAGIVKIGHVIGELDEWDENAAAELIAASASGAMGKNKISFGISVYDLGNSKRTRELEGEIDSLGGSVKRFLKESGRPVRYVTSKEPRLSSAIVETNGLLLSGGEYVLLVGPDSILIGQTEAVQDFKAWGDRDYGRPKRDKRSGMLPPKLARMMINLSGIEPEGHSIMDPFCGSGTVLMEAQLMGFEKIVGSDISERATADTKKNMNWMTRHFELAPPDLELFTTPAATLVEQYSEPVDVIVAEVFLGTPRVRTIEKDEAASIRTELMGMFEESFEGLKTFFKDETMAVVAFPAYKQTDGNWYRLPIGEMLEKLGFNVTDNVLYFRDKQFVARDIYTFTK